MSRKYYWLKLKNNFFTQKHIKKLRQVAGGDTYTIIYLKMQLLSTENDGKLVYDGLEKTFEEELALVLDEAVDNVRFTLIFLQQYDLIEELPESEYLLLEACENIGSEGSSAERMRNHRAKKNTREAINYAEFVKLTEGEYNTLVEKHGEQKTIRMIEKLDNYKGSTGKKYKDDYRAILNWVVKEVQNETPKLENKYADVKL